MSQDAKKQRTEPLAHAAPEHFQKQANKAAELEQAQPAEALKIYESLVHSPELTDDKLKETAIIRAAELYAKAGHSKEVSKLLVAVRPFFNSLSKARTAKIVRLVLDAVSKVPGSVKVQVDLCKECIEWAKEEKRTFLRQRLETKLASLYIQTKDYNLSLALLAQLLKEVKKLDDKPLLVELHLIESQVHHSLRNIAKAKAALTAARTHANAIYCPPPLQGEIERQAGMLHSEESDFKTAYSYFYEAFETFNGIEDATNALVALKYMLMTKIMTGHPEEVQGIISGKVALKYAGRDVEAIRRVAAAAKQRSLKDFQATIDAYPHEIRDDRFIDRSLTQLYETLLQQNLVRLIEPFSVVEISHVAELIGLPKDLVEQKLSQMILDGKFQGILDQGSNQLSVYDEPKLSSMYQTGLDSIDNISKVVDSLYDKMGLLRS
jgi:26S proteasome regulatory subunit N6